MRNFIRNELPWLLLSLIFAVALWLYFTGQNVMPRDIIAVPAYSDPPRNLFVNRDELPPSLVITVEATSAQFQLIERGNSSKVTVAVDLSAAKAGENDLPVSLEGTVSPPLPRNIRNPKPSPSSIKFYATPIRRREVPVRPPDEAHVLATFLQPTGPWEITPPVASVEAPEDMIDSIPELSTRFVTPGRMISDVDNTQLLAPVPPPKSESWFRVVPDRFTAHLPVEIRTKTMSFYRDVALLPAPSEDPAALGPHYPVALDPPAVRVTLSFRADRPEDRRPGPSDVFLTASVDPHEVKAGSPVSVDVVMASEIPGVTVTLSPATVDAVRLDERAWNEMSERIASESLQELTGPLPAPGDSDGTLSSPEAAPAPASPAPAHPSDITRPETPPEEPAPDSGAPGGAGAGAPANPPGNAGSGSGGRRRAAGAHSGASGGNAGNVSSPNAGNARRANTGNAARPNAGASGNDAGNPPRAGDGASGGDAGNATGGNPGNPAGANSGARSGDSSDASGAAGPPPAPPLPASGSVADASGHSIAAGGEGVPDGEQAAPGQPVPALSVPGSRGHPHRVESGEVAKVMNPATDTKPAVQRRNPDG
ncbi:MAG: hypothetical protein LBQ12_03120 [Deltaproteobacteria bacterium]|jgi:hypothetical protein|nr:hypothetical protein [Deltaproteobacteria bacterium]